MVSYIDWVQTVARAVLRDRPSHFSYGIAQLASDLGVSGGDELTLALDHVLSDLAVHGIVIYNHRPNSIEYPPEARRFRVEPLSAMWPVVRSGFLSADDEAFLSVLAGLSEHRGDRLADVMDVRIADVFQALGWTPEADRALAIYRHLRERSLVAGLLLDISGSIRITYAGLVRVLDESGRLLREAEEHIQADRLRAAGCVAAVELERRLKQLIGGPPKVSRKRDPGLEDYNQAAFGAGKIDQETWRSISALAVIRKRCVHVLDREPETEEVRLLLDGVERILRRYPSA